MPPYEELRLDGEFPLLMNFSFDPVATDLIPFIGTLVFIWSRFGLAVWLRLALPPKLLFRVPFYAVEHLVEPIFEETLVEFLEYPECP